MRRRKNYNAMKKSGKKKKEKEEKKRRGRACSEELWNHVGWQVRLQFCPSQIYIEFHSLQMAETAEHE
jgi:hypothetical protein